MYYVWPSLPDLKPQKCKQFFKKILKAYKEVELSSPHSWNLHKGESLRTLWNSAGHNFSTKKPKHALCLPQLGQKLLKQAAVEMPPCFLLATLGEL